MIKQGNDKVNRIFYRGTDDVARAVLGGDWRMPTYEEFAELRDNTTTTIKDDCMIYKSKINDNSIIFPLAGRMNGNTLYSTSTGFYLVSLCNSATNCNYFYMYSAEKAFGGNVKYQGRSVRAVSPTQGVDLGLSVKWAECNVGANTPTEYGNYYAWGELAPKIDYSWATYKFNPSGDGVTFTKYNATDGKRTLELDCECEIEKVMQGGDVIFFKPIEYTKDFSSENLSLVSACAVLDALQPVSTPQTITFSAYTSALIMDDDTAMEKVMSAMEIGWNIVLN